MSPVLAGAVGLLLCGGLVALLYGLRRTERAPAARRGTSESLSETWTRLTRRPLGPAGRRRDLILLGSVLVGVVIAALSGWLVAIVLVPLLALGLPALLAVPPSREVELLEALDRWVRNLAATLPTGKSIPDAIRLSRRTAPPLLQEPLGSLVVRLNNRWSTQDALGRFADDLNSPDADGVIAALILAANRGSNGASVTLNALADSLQAQLKARRIVETERAKPYLVVRQVVIISLAGTALLTVLSPGYFQPYRTALGSLILAVLAGLLVLCLALMRRVVRSKPRERILVGMNR